MAKQGKAVRMGPISLFVLIVVVCVAVLAALSFTTAQAQYTVAKRQASMETSYYANDAVGERLLFEANEQLPAIWATGASPSSAAGTLCSRLNATISEAAQARGVSLGLLESDGNTIKATISAPDGRTLNIVLELKRGANVEVKQWKITTERNEEITDGKLFTGSGM